VDKKQFPILGIDLGGTKIAASIIIDTDTIGKPKRVPTPHGKENIIQALLKLIEEFKQDNLIVGVGIATAGIVNPDTGEVIGSTGNLPGWEGTPIKKIIEEKMALPVHVENDANASAYAEYRASKFKADTCLVTVTLGTGIGVGIVINGSLYRGAHFAAGECGHLKVSLNNHRRCTCGLWDCWEAYGSGRGFVATGYDALSKISAHQSKLALKKEKLTTEDIIEAAKDNDLVAKQIIETWHEHVAAGMVSLCHTLDPDCFVITGGMGKFVDYVLLKDLIMDMTLPRISEKLEIYPSSLGERGGMIGVAELVLDTFNSSAKYTQSLQKK
jgi:glucokinase